MTFSILIAHYNNYKYFKECYQSILNQTYKNIEIILVDDCSTDNSFEKIKELTKDNTNIHLYKNDINKGVGYTKKRCVDLAHGEICGFLDPDDAITSNAIQDAIQEFSDEKTIAVYSQIKICDKKLKYIKIFEGQKQIKNNSPLFFNVNFEVNHFFAFRKSAYEKTIGINENLTSAVDQDLYLKLYEIGHFKFIKKGNYLYRIHEQGVSQNKQKKTKLNENWHQVLLETTRRRNIDSLYGKNVDEITNLPFFIKSKQNTLISKILKRLTW